MALVEKVLPGYFGDAGPDNVVVKSVEDNALVWYNKTLAYAGCADAGVRWMRKMMLKDGGEGEEENGRPKSRVRPELRDHFADYDVLDARVTLIGSCARADPDPGEDGGGGEGGGGGDVETRNDGDFIFHGLIPSSEYLMTFLVPAVIIILMLLLALLLACVLHRKRKAGKLNLFYSEALPPRVPVILQDELYDDASDPYLSSRQMVLDGGGGQPHHQPPRPMVPLSSASATPSEGDALLFQEGSRPTPVYRRH